MADSKKNVDDLTKEELYEEAQAKDIPGRSEMSKEELAEAVEAPQTGDLTELAKWRKNEYEGGRPAGE